jgi:hypothetical protein
MVREENTNQQNHTILSSQRQPKSGAPNTNLSFFSYNHQLKCDAPCENHCHCQAISVTTRKLCEPMELHPAVLLLDAWSSHHFSHTFPATISQHVDKSFITN